MAEKALLWASHGYWGAAAGPGGVSYAVQDTGWPNLIWTRVILYLIKSKGPARVDGFSYLDDLGRYTYQSLHTPDASARARRHVAFRASTVLLVLTVGELAVLFGFWHESDSALGSYVWQVVVAGIIALVIGIWQMVITRRIDYYVVNPPSKAA